METVSYEQDLYAWGRQNAELLRQGRLSEVDIEHVAEELDGMTRSIRRELINRLAVLIAHLLKWQFQPERRSNSWKNTIEVQREDATELIEESPSLRYEIDEKPARAYKKAVRLAAVETGMRTDAFPKVCPYSLEEIIGEGCWPD
jgi:hypothetical protein